MTPSESEIGYQLFTGDSTTYFPIWIGNNGIISFKPTDIPTNTYSPYPGLYRDYC